LTVPTDPDFSRIVHFEYESGDGLVFQSSVGAKSGKYPFYPGLDPRSWSGKATFTTPNGFEQGPELYDLLDSDDALLAAQLCLSNERLTVHAAIGAGFHGNTTNERIRAEIKAANNQLRNGQKYRPAPGICVIYHGSLDFAADLEVVSALFGDLVMSISDNGKLGNAVHGKNGAWSSTKNRGVSALRYVRTDVSATLVINPWAEFQIDNKLFRERVWTVENGQPVQR
jgi:hypothetical protein